MWVAGVDGCKVGWVLASRRDADPIDIKVVTSFNDVIAYGFDVVAVDIPIGLPDAGHRECDRQARQAIGPRRSSVFPCPIRPTLQAQDYQDACRIGRAADGRGMSKQAWSILPKIREVDDQMESALQSRIIEVHPEVSFWAMAGRVPLNHPKRRSAGKELRRTLLEEAIGYFPGERVPGAGTDDVLDALAALWTAGRYVANAAEKLSSDGSFDDRGLEMAIWF
jgi:predicted RNase H-like nuclease